jgi:hypothetical protein
VLRFAPAAVLVVFCGAAVFWSACASAQSAGGYARTMKALDADCIAFEVDQCVARELPSLPPLAGQNMPTIDYRDGSPCVEGITVGPDGQVTGACDYNPSLHRNTAKIAACELRVRANPPPQCQSEVLTARGTEELVHRAVEAQTKALREALLVQCRAFAHRREDCDGLRPEGQ